MTEQALFVVLVFGPLMWLLGLMVGDEVVYRRERRQRIREYLARRNND